MIQRQDWDKPFWRTVCIVILAAAGSVPILLFISMWFTG